jgi:hypothetical protein
MENREYKRNKSRTTGIRRMIKMEEENGIEANKVRKKVKGRMMEILSEQQNRKGIYIQHNKQ